MTPDEHVVALAQAYVRLEQCKIDMRELVDRLRREYPEIDVRSDS